MQTATPIAAAVAKLQGMARRRRRCSRGRGRPSGSVGSWLPHAVENPLHQSFGRHFLGDSLDDRRNSGLSSSERASIVLVGMLVFHFASSTTVSAKSFCSLALARQIAVAAAE